jgi:hypothetical protein
MRVLIVWFALASVLPAQDKADSRLWLDLYTTLGSELFEQIYLTPTGCWKGLLMNRTSGTALSKPPIPAASSRRRRKAEATVEVWDFALPEESTRYQGFRLFKEDLLLSIKENWRFAPPTHGQIDAAIRGGGNGAGSDMAMVQSLQQRFNQLPPHGSPVK